MLYSQFYDALEEVCGSALGRSMMTDLFVPSLGATAADALERGDDPQKVWEALIAELDLDPQLAWIHRWDPKKRRR
ncbi:MAG: DUF3046 domain-containing protein [Actinomycetaceae bacterium]|nr:DUF3046 domain-containing protein [Actinomycetaceae bacterium]MDU0970014.1 DUF3046 domain-containing protein [Actinomycetaceae bacterium]